jgi:hypothetical protein
MNNKILLIAKNKASQSISRYRVSALGFNKKGELVCTSFNKPRFERKGGGTHAEMQVMRMHPKSVKVIIICRTGGKGDLLPIHACATCQSKANDLGIKIKTISN